MRHIVTDEFSSAGNLKAARVADRVAAVGSPLDPGLRPDELPGLPLDDAEAADRLELWMGPGLDGQLALCEVAEAVAARPALAAKTVVALLDRRLGEQTPEWTRGFTPTFVPFSAVQPLAQTAWRAFGAATPAPWAALLRADTSALPRLEAAARAWLRELPDATTGLSASQRLLLEAAGGGLTVRERIGDLLRSQRSPFGYWRLGALLVELCAASTPAITGPRDTFTLEMHDDRARHTAFMEARLARTALGEAVLAGQEDYLRHNPPPDGWGRGWRWDPSRDQVVPSDAPV